MSDCSTNWTKPKAMPEPAEFIFKRHNSPDARIAGWKNTGIEIVRCRECKFWGSEEREFKKCAKIGIIGGGLAYTLKDFYCAWGER